MKKVLLSFLSTFTLIYVLNKSFGSAPSVAKILNPFCGIWQNAEPKKHPLKNKQIEIKAKDSIVKVNFDENLIPHIIAQTDRDLYYAQGYIIAMFRLWQVDTLSRIIKGELSEVFGNKSLNNDRLMRRNNFPEIISNIINNLKINHPTIYSNLEAYCEGLNNYTKNLSYKDLPIEYKLINYWPKHFTPEDLVSCGILVMHDMSNTNKSVENTLDFYDLGEKLYNIIHKERYNENFPVINKMFSNQTKIEIKKLDGMVSLDDLKLISEVIVAPPVISKFISIEKNDKDIASMGSNCWAIAAKKSKNKKSTFLASDPHLKLSFPSLFFINCLETPNNRVFGFSIPGVPDVLFGKNKYIAWGVTNGSICVSTFYKITFKDDKCEEYFIENQWKKVKVKEEVIKVKGEKNFIDRVLYTDHGPIVYDEHFNHETGVYNLAIKYTVQEPLSEFVAMYKINRAKNYSEFKKAIEHFGSPILNMSFISNKGDIALNVIGNFPVIKKGLNEFIYNGEKEEYLWSDKVQLHNCLEELNPKRGYVSSANQRITNSTFSFVYKPYAMQQYRGVRINKLLDEKNDFSIRDVLKMQNDSYNSAAEHSLDLIFQYIKKEDLDSKFIPLLELLVTWDLKNEPDSLAPSIFKQWQSELLNIMWKELYPIKTEISFFNTIEILHEGKLDLKEYVNIENIVKEAFNRACHKILDWEKNNNKKAKWTDYRELKINHIAYIPSFGKHSSRVPGGKDIISSNEGIVGASYKMVVVFENGGGKSYVSYPGGQSGNPGSFYYDNFFELWEQGTYLKFDL